MTHYEERLEGDLKRIRTRVASVAEDVQEALKNAVHALLSGNEKLAYATIMGDAAINRAVREVDRLCNAFVALHLPSAGHLRVISSVMRASVELERLGDYAVTISRESVQLSEPPTGSVGREIDHMAQESRGMLAQAVTAFNEDNAEMARATMRVADQVERTFDNAFADLTAEPGRNIKELFALLVVFNLLERVSDQAKNLCEETLYMVTGETKPPKVFGILFVDEDNACLSQMAEAIARKTFPGSGRYASAGRTAADAISPALVAFMEERGLDLSEAKPKALDLTPAELAPHYAIVSLSGPVRSYVPEIPFRTVALEWDVGEAPDGLGEQETRKRLEAIYRDIALHVRDLMEQLRGEGAS